MADERRKPRRRYSPKVEALEAIRMLDAAAARLAPWAVEPAPFAALEAATPRLDLAETAAWDHALDEAGATVSPGLVEIAPAASDPAEVSAGLAQLDRYLAKTWARAGIAPHWADDCSQAVYETMLQNLGRARFEGLMTEVHDSGIPRVLNRETPAGLDFLRAIDMVKKRTLRQRKLATLDDGLDVPSKTIGTDGGSEGLGLALRETIDRTLSPKEADLIRETLLGFSPAEIALRRGVAPKTVSNEKSRVFQKLRDALEAEIDA